MHSLFRNPLLQLLRRLWWLPMAGLAVAWSCGEKYAWLTVQLIGAALAFVSGLIVAALAHGAWARLVTSLRHYFARHRFLCPGCLHFGGFRFACSACGQAVESFMALTGGAYFSACASCHADLSGKTAQVRACCEHCLTGHDLTLHQRRVQIIVTLCPADFESCCRIAGAALTPARSFEVFSHTGRDLRPHYLPQPGPTALTSFDDGECLRYVLHFDPEAGLAATDLPNHALRQVEVIWIDAAASDPLRLGRITDAFIRQSGLSESQRRKLTVFVRQQSPEAAIRNKLAASFGEVRCGCEPETLLRPTATVDDDYSANRSRRLFQTQRDKEHKAGTG